MSKIKKIKSKKKKTTALSSRILTLLILFSSVIGPLSPDLKINLNEEEYSSDDHFNVEVFSDSKRKMRPLEKLNNSADMNPYSAGTRVI